MPEMPKISLDRPAPQPGEQGYVVPTDLVPLPSKGKVYPTESPLHRSETVEIRSMTARDEDILTSRALLKQGKAISTLLKSCLSNKSIDPDQMLIGDRNAVLIAVRITGYGSEYDTEVACPSCDEKFKYKFDLGKLPVKPLDVEPLAVGSNAFAYELPVSKKPVVFKILTGEDEREINTMAERNKKALGAGAPETAITTRLQFQIVSLGGESDRQKISQLVRNLPAMDSRKLRNHIDSISPGVEMVQTAECPHCGTASEVDVPMGTEFFWPQGG